MEVTPITKEKRVRLHGDALKELNKAIHERDDYTCIIKGCKTCVPISEKFHHYPFGCNKSDEIEKGVTLCYKHHDEAHNKKRAELAEQCAEYLAKLYRKGGQDIDRGL